jgi:stress-induced morphogen
VVDVSDGCGSKFEVEIESPQFEGKALLARHRLVRGVGSATSCVALFSHPRRPLTAASVEQVNEALKEEMKAIHALSIKRAVPPPSS